MRRARVVERLVVVALAAGSFAAMAEPMTVSSTSFADGATIPALHAAGECGGQDVTPAIAWSGLPPGAKSVVIVMRDPDGRELGWLVYGVAAERGELRAGEAGKDDVGILVGRNSSGTAVYRGMCPPVGDRTQRYVLTVLATDLPTTLFEPGLAYERLLRSLEGHVLQTGSIVGRYVR